MAYTPPNDLFTSEEAILSLASSIADEDRTHLGNGTVNGALDVLADALADQNVEVPPMNAGAILALAQYVTGGGGGGGDFTIAEVTIVNNTGGLVILNAPVVSAEYRMSAFQLGTADASATYTVAMYMGTASAAFDAAVFSVSATGDAEIAAQSIIITGDCTLTFTLAN